MRSKSLASINKHTRLTHSAHNISRMFFRARRKLSQRKSLSYAPINRGWTAMYTLSVIPTIHRRPKRTNLLKQPIQDAVHPISYCHRTPRFKYSCNLG